MAVDPSIAAAEAEAAARRSEEAAEAFFRAAPPLRDRDRISASVADFVARHSAGKPPFSPRSRYLIPLVGPLVYTRRGPALLNPGLAAPDPACCRERRCGRARRRRQGDLHHLRRHHGAPGAALRALHRQLRLRPAGGGRHRVHTHTHPAPSSFCCHRPAWCSELSVVKCRYFLKAGYAVIFIYRR